jgi:DNA (cytosine-5)-methyltransferase 1
MKALSLFSGIGGIDLACEWAGIETVAFCEIDPFCRKVLKKHWPHVPCFEDVTKLKGSDVGTVDLIHGGFPCQDISPAGKRAGLQGKQSGLWSEFLRVISETKPVWTLIENNGHRWRSWVPEVRRNLWRIGYASVSLRVRARDVAAWHDRNRVFVVADLNGVLLREQSRRRFREIWESTTFACRAGAPWAFADTDSQREPQSKGGELYERRWVGDCLGSWGSYAGAIEPTLARGVHGVPDRMASERALGNAVVPQQVYPILAAIKQIHLSPQGDE